MAAPESRMNVLDDLVASLNLDAAVRDVRQGVFHTGVLTGDCGLAATLPRDALRQKPPMVRESGHLLEKSAGELVRMAYSESILEAAIGVAAVNSLLEVDEEACVERNASELIIEKGKGKRVAVVGHFPFIPRVRDAAGELWVIEKNPKEGDRGEAEAGKIVPTADVVAITGTALTNHTLDHLLDLTRPGAYVILVGDSAPLSTVLFDHGVDAVAGTKVVDPALALRCVSEGANFRQIRGTRQLVLTRE
jgi:uncharacterized protein (DUF4213/DUF364 family)